MIMFTLLTVDVATSFKARAAITVLMASFIKPIPTCMDIIIVT